MTNRTTTRRRRRRPASRKSRSITPFDIKNHRGYEVKSLGDFVSFLGNEFLDRDTILLRGQQEDWPLLPKIARFQLRPPNSILDTERLLLQDFKLQALPLVDSEPETEWEWLSLAQHYGIPTRLLDWTSNALAALWFAIRTPAVPSKTGAMPPAIVWVLDPREDDYVRDLERETPTDGERTRVFRPNHIARRIVAQSGWFTVHKYIGRMKEFVPFDQQGRYRHSLTKILVPASLFCDIRYELDRCGVNAASMLSDLTGLCQHISWSHSLLADEHDN